MKASSYQIMEPAEKVAKFVKANGLPFRTLLDEDGSVAGSFGVVGVPTIVLIDKNGHIIAAGHRTLDLPLKKELLAK